jgi:hypothetical protein
VMLMHAKNWEPLFWSKKKMIFELLASPSNDMPCCSLMFFHNSFPLFFPSLKSWP